MTTEDPSQQLLSQLRRDKVLQEREDRRQRSEDKKALEQARIQEIQDWEDNFIGGETKKELRTMWEIPQIGLFVYLCMETLGLDEEITQYQLERGLVAPRECSDFKRLMTCLLSTPHQRKSLKTLMPYHVWNSKLTVKVAHFYKILSDCNGNHQQACYKLGFDNRAFKILGKKNPLLKKSFHELSFLKRVWILKSFCDFCLETQNALQKTIEEVEAERPMDVREVLLGSDGRGNRYINFPMFTGKDIRIYRHPKLQEPNLRSLGLEDWSMADEKPSNASSRCSTPVNQRSQRLYDQPSSSLRARAILQAAESKEASPMRDISRTGSDFQDENSNSNMDADSISSELTEGSGKKSGSSSKKRKRAGYYGGKRKRVKGGTRKQIILEERAESPNVEKEFEVVTGDQERSPSPLPTELPKESANHNAKAVPERSSVCDKDTSSNDCDMTKNLLSTLPVVTQPELEEANDCESNTTSSNPAQLFNNYATNVEKNSTIPTLTDPSPSKEKEENVSSSSVNSDTKNQDSAYLSCDSDRSFKTEENDKSTPPKTENDLVKEEKMDIDETSLNDQDLKISNENEISEGNVSDGEKMENKDSIDIFSSAQAMKKVVIGGDENKVTNFFDSKTLPMDSKPTNLKTEVNKDEGQVDDKESTAMEVKSETPIKTDSPVDEEKAPSEVKEEVPEEEESDDEEIPDLGSIELICESMDEIRQLINKLSNPDPIKRGKRVYPGVIKPCEEELLGNLQRFHDELTKYERSLFNARFHAQVKLRKEVENYVEVKIEDNKGWESENSQSSKESSDDEDSELKKEVVPKEKPKRSRSKANAAAAATSTSELLSSAVNKLSTISGDANEDSNDSYELDISSRGRLRKRRVIPNNIEDTGVKRRKNLNQDLPSAVTSASASPSANTVISSNNGIASGPQQQPLKSWQQQVLSVVSSPPNSAIKAQLTSPTKPVLPCQIVRLVSPSGDASYKAVHVASKRNMVLSPENMANIRFVSSTAVLTVPKNSIINSSSSAHSSHPVIQQLLLNQARHPVAAGGNLPVVKNVASMKGNITSQVAAAGILQSLSGGSAAKSPTAGMSSGNIKVTLVSPTTQASSSSMPTTAKTPSTTAVVVTQVSTSIISHGGKQILDLGSLSVTQIQQLVKNQAIQINTGAGNPTTLLLTKGLQQLATSKISTQLASTTIAPSAATNCTLQIRMPMQRNPTPKPDMKEFPAKCLLSLSQGNSKVQVTIPTQTNSQAGSMTVLSGRQVSPHLPVIRTIINRPMQNASIIRAVNPSAIGASIPVSHVSGAAARLPTVSQGTFTVVPGSVLPRQAPAPRIISSIPTTLTNLSSSSQGSANKENPPVLINNIVPGVDKQSAEIIDPKKSNFVNIPFSPHSSPQKKYASNVTVKALLENRTFIKKSDSDGVASVFQGKVSNMPGAISKAILANISQEVVSTSGSSCEFSAMNSSPPLSAAAHSLPSESTQSEISNTPINSMKAIPDTTESVRTESDIQNHPVATISGTTSNTLIPTSMQPLSVDTAFQPLLSSTVQVTLPTVNIKVPSPNTLPSLTHNKNSTFIVQSTKVPIPVASAEATKSNEPSISPTQGQSGEAIISSAARMVASTVDTMNIGTAIASQTSSQATVINPRAAITVSTPGGAVNLKNVMLKLTPPKGATAGPFVQGFMTSKGKLVIPQNALLQQHPQQVIQASPSRVILANTAYNSQLQTNQLQQVRPTQVAATNVINQNVIKNVAFSQNSVLQPIQQQNGQVVIASQSTGTISGASAQAIPIQNANPGIKVMLINQSNVPQLHQTGVIHTATTASITLSRPQSLQTNTPASELVKQIANSTQLLASVQQQGQASKINPIPIQQSNASIVNLNTASQSSSGLSSQSISGQVSLKSGHQTQQANLNPQLAAQLLALQQSGKSLRVKQVQPQQQHQTGIVLAAKSAAIQQQQQQPTQSPVMAMQLQQLGNQLLPGVGSIAQVQAPTSQLQSTVGAKSVQTGQVVQLALNPQAANPNPATVLTTGQPQAHIVQMGSQLSPHMQLAASQSVSQLPQGGIILQQANILQNQQQAVIRTQNTANVLPMQVNSINQQKATAQSLKQPQVGLGGHVASLTQPTQHTGSQAQIQLVINSSATSSSAPLPLGSVGTVLRKQTPMSAVNIPQLTSSQQIIRAIVNPGAGTSAISAPRLMSPTKPALSINSSPQGVLGTSTQLSQVLTQNIVNPTQVLISPMKLTAQLPQMNRTTPVKLINPSSSILQPGLVSGANTSQFIQKIQLNNSDHGTAVSQSGNLTQKPIVSAATPITNNAVNVAKENSAHCLPSQPTANIISLKQNLVAGEASSQNHNTLTSTQSIASFLSSTRALVRSNEPLVMETDSLHKNSMTPMPSQQAPITPITNLMADRISHNSVVTVSSSMVEGKPELITSQHAVSNNKSNVQNSNSLFDPQRNDNVQENGMGLDTIQNTDQNSSETKFASPSKSGSGRRNTFSGSQQNPKTVQRNTSVDDSSSLISKEMDEKEAALNLLTLANQPL